MITMESELKIGVVGTGAIGRTHVERISRRLRGGRVVAVSDIDASQAKRVAEEYGCRFVGDGHTLIRSDDIDAVIVATTDTYHEEYVTAAIEASKFVFCEKPLAPDRDGARRIVDSEIAGGRLLVQVGFMRRYDAGYLALKRLVDARTYGEPLMVHCAHRNLEARENYTTPMVVANTLIHEIDVLRWLLNEEYATVEVVFPKTTRHAHPNLRDPQIMILTTESGVRIDVEAFVNCRYGYDIKCEVCCEDGVLNLPQPSDLTVFANGARVSPIAEHWSERFVAAYDAELQEWITASNEGRVDGPTSWDGYLGSVTATAASASRDRQSVVKVEAEKCPEFYVSRRG